MDRRLSTLAFSSDDIAKGMMKSILFRDQLVEFIRTTHSAIPIDVAVTKVAVSQATVIEGGRALRTLVRKYNNQWVDFGDLTNAQPPVGTDNLFFEIHASKTFPPPDDEGRLGVHIVPLSIAKESVLFSEYILQPLPEQLLQYPKIYIMIVYRERNNLCSTLPVGMMIGIDDKGSLSSPGFYKLISTDVFPYDYKQVAKYMALIGYSVFRCFSQVNSGEMLCVRVLEEGETPFYRLVKRELS